MRMLWPPSRNGQDRFEGIRRPAGGPLSGINPRYFMNQSAPRSGMDALNAIGGQTEAPIMPPRPSLAFSQPPSPQFGSPLAAAPPRESLSLRLGGK